MTKQEELATKKDLGELEGRLTTQIGANATKIDGNAAKIDGNAAKIDANATKIDQVEKNLSAKIDVNATKIDANAAKIDANAAKIDRVERNLGAKIDANSEAISKLTSLALENKDDIKKMATREYMDKRLDDIVTGQDKMIKLYMNLDQERTATKGRVDRIEGDVEENKSKIRELEAKVAR